jgi:hypothetical protein
MRQALHDGGLLCSSPVSDARFLVIHSPGDMPAIDGSPMVRGVRQPCSAVVRPTSDCDLYAARRYVDAISGLRLLCMRPGRGSLSFQGRPLTQETLPTRRLVAAGRRFEPAAGVTEAHGMKPVTG